MGRLVYLNGLLVVAEEAKVSVFDYGFLYGYGLFETMRAYGGKVFRLGQHLGRLFAGAAVIGLAIRHSPKQIEEAIQGTLQVNHLGDAYVRVHFSYGVGPPGLGFAEEPLSNFVVVVDNLPANLAERYAHGVKAIISTTRQNHLSALVRVKSTNFLNNAIARLEARDRGVDEAILLNCDGLVAEAATSNIFLVYNNSLVTPSEEMGILPGVTRSAVMELAKRLGWKVVERGVTVEELMVAEECFITNSVAELVAVVEIDGKAIGAGKPGKIVRDLHRAYQELVKAETKGGVERIGGSGGYAQDNFYSW